MRDISQLHPRLQTKIAELQSLCDKEGLILGIGECLRTVEEQDELYAQGRTKAGSIVTYATGTSYSSQHQWGIAFDFFKNVSGHAYDDNSFFCSVGALAKSIGLGWGGDWTDFRDMPHIYLPDWGDTPAPLKKQYLIPDKFFESWTSTSNKITVDGFWGSETTRALQELFQTPEDGIVSGQWVGWKGECPGVVSSFEWSANPSGSEVVKALQGMLGTDQDGIFGGDTIRALQVKFGVNPDGVLDYPSATIKRLQEWINNQRG